MNARIFTLAACGMILLGSGLVGCGSKSNPAPSSATGTAANDTSAASYNNATTPEAQRYQQAIKQSGSTKSPYSR